MSLWVAVVPFPADEVLQYSLSAPVLSEISVIPHRVSKSKDLSFRADQRGFNIGVDKFCP